MLLQIGDIFLSFLPPRYRARYQMEIISGTFRSGIMEAVLGALIWFGLFWRFLHGDSPVLSGAVVSKAADISGRVVMAGGLVGYLSFLISPGPLLAMFVAIEGVLRMVSGIMNQPMASLPFVLIGGAHDLADRWVAQWRKAPPAPDMVEFGQPGQEWDMRITAVHPKPDWRSLVQIAYCGVHYSIVRGGEELVEGKACYRYYLKKVIETHGFHGVIHYDPFEFWKK